MCIYEEEVNWVDNKQIQRSRLKKSITCILNTLRNDDQPMINGCEDKSMIEMIKSNYQDKLYEYTRQPTNQSKVESHDDRLWIHFKIERHNTKV